MTYAHYALMGGFAADVEDIHNKLERVTLATDGIKFLAKNGYFCQLDPGDIEDKSKADYLAKGLVCVQVVWIIGQAIERKIANLPITLLEAHTIVHVVCALIMYALWYQKPLNVVCPTVLEFGKDRDLFAFILETSAPRDPYTRNVLSPPSRLYKYTRRGEVMDFSFNSGFVGELYRGGSHKFEPDIYFCKPVCLISDPNISNPSCGSIYQHSVSPSDKLDLKAEFGAKFVPSKGEICCTMVSGQCLDSKIGFFYHKIHSGGYKSMEPCEVSLTSKDVERLRLVGRAWQRLESSVVNPYGNRDNPNDHLITLGGQKCRALQLGRPLKYQSSNVRFSVLSNVFSTPNVLLWIALAIIPSAYGGVHLTALNLSFSTTTERLLWKVSCYYLVAAAGFICIFCIIWEAYNSSHSYRLYSSALARWWFRQKYMRRIMRQCFELSFWGILSLFPLAVLAYVAARIFLVVESFISLRQVPIGVYQVPDLDIMGNIPHL